MRAAWIVMCALLASACGTDTLVQERSEIIPELRPDPAYDRLFPRYVELCAVSQFRSKVKGFGGVPGHAVMYLKGACKDETAAYPRLRPCRREARSNQDPEHGVGVSVNRWFRNVNWVAVPGRHLFYAGGLPPGERLTQERVDAAVRRGIGVGIYRGVLLHEYPTPETQRSLEDFVLRQSLSTDFALQFSRSVFCARMPVTEPMLARVMDFLNELNREYFEGEADYEWSGFADNCVHTLRNALAAASIWSPLSVRAIKLRQIFNLAIPANEFVNLARLGTEGPIDDFGQVSRNREQRTALLEYDWLPTRHGALVKTLPVHAENDVYDTTFRVFVLEGPFSRRSSRAAVQLLSDRRFVDLEANLNHFAEVYDAILAEREDDPSEKRRRYYAYIEAQRAEVAAMLERL